MSRAVRVTGPSIRRVATGKLIAPAAALLLWLAGATFAADLPQPGGPPNDPQFETDGNLMAEVAAKLDWDDTSAGGTTFPGTAVIEAVRNPDGSCAQTNSLQIGAPGDAGGGVLVCDGSAGNFADQNSFTGGSKEENPLSSSSTTTEWMIKNQGNPKKGDLAETYVYAKIGDSAFDADTLVDDLFLFADMTRLDVNGSMHADFEFNHLALDDCGDADATTFCQPRSDGDIIMAFDLSQGGNTPIIRIFQFRTTLNPGEVCANSPQVSSPPGCYVEITAPLSGPGGEPAQLGVLNSVEIDAPSWRSVGCETTSDDGSSGCKLRNKIPAKGNVEGFIDLTAFLGDDFPLCPGFGQLTVKTRASDSLNAELKDTTAPIAINLSVCGSIIVKKFDDDGNLLPGAGFTFDPNPFDVLGSPIEIKDGDPEDQADDADGIVCLDGVLFPETYTVTETFVPPGFFGDPDTETVIVSTPSTCAERLANDEVDASFTNVRARPVIRVTKTCTAAVNAAGTGVDVSFGGQVCNDGNVELTGVTVSDDQGSVTQQPSGTLAPGACSPYSGSYTSGAASNTDTVTATGTGGLGSGTVTDTDTANCTAEVNPVIRVTKTCTAAVNAAGTGVDVSFGGQVCNDGNVELSGVTVSDDQGSVTQQPSGTLAPGACSPYSGSYTSGMASNTDTVTASGTGAVGSGLVSDTDTANCTATLSPAIRVSKTCTAAVNAAGTGVDVSFGGQVCNDGNVELGGVTVSDDQGSVTQQPSGTLAPGACSPYSGSYTSGTASNTDTATASGTGAVGSGVVSNTATAMCEATLTPRISVTKECDTVLVLDEATNKLTVRVDFSGEVCAKDDQGDSNVQLTGVSVVEVHDNQSQTVLSNATIAPGACQSYSGSFFPTSLDGSSGTSDDTVTASGTGSLGAGSLQTGAIPASCNLCPLPS